MHRLFIHIMPCATLHVLVHLIPQSMQLEKFSAIHTIKYSAPSAPEHYTLWDMIIWATLPYAIWQLSYHFLITVRKRTKIAAGRPTSFTWLRRSYRGNFLGKFVLGFPESMQEAVFMGIQYTYALLTMLPCPVWFWYRWASAGFLGIVFTWASWNGATYYIDVFGKRMEKELEQLRKEVSRMAKSPEIAAQERALAGESPFTSPAGPQGMESGMDGVAGKSSALDLGPAATNDSAATTNGIEHRHRREKSEDSAMLSDAMTADRPNSGQFSGHFDAMSQPGTPGLELKKMLGNPAAQTEANDTPDLNGSVTDVDPSVTDAGVTDTSMLSAAGDDKKRE